jgi:hypothetical protein
MDNWHDVGVLVLGLALVAVCFTPFIEGLFRGKFWNK